MLQIIAGKHKKRKLIAPKSSQVRPTTSQLREMLFNICQHRIEGARFLDLFAGSGVIGLEALSRGAKEVTFVEKARPALTSIKRNIMTLGEEKHTRVISGDVLAVLPLLQGSFDLIYVDPPYEKGLSQALLDSIDARPSVLALDGLLFIEDSSLKEPQLNNLELKQKRHMGRTTLFEYVHCSHSQI